MALDESRDNDQVIADSGITFLVEKGLFDQAQPITIDFTEGPMGEGFAIDSKMAKKDSSSCGSCSC
jgi:Fe-S cluster assembly iron-binding protein IscA